MSPIGWYEQDPTPALWRDVCVLCDVDRLTHNDFDCARWVAEADACPQCEGAGVLGDVRRSDYDGRKCAACGGDGFVESSSGQGEPA